MGKTQSSNSFVDLVHESDGFFVLKESSLGSTYLDKVLGNGFSIYVILVVIFGLTHREKRPALQSPGTTDQPIDQLKIKLANRTYFVPLTEINYIRSSQNYSELFTSKGKHIIRETLTALEEKLDPDSFIRIHRSAIINTREVEEFISSPNGDYKVKLKEDVLLNIGNKYKKQVLSRFEVL